MIDLSTGEKAIQFVNYLTHVHGKWGHKPFELRDWQAEIVRNLFGRLDENGNRQYRECGIWLPRKNGKSELCAAIALYMLLCEPEEHGQIYSAAAERDQASLVFNTAAAMLRANPDMMEHVNIIDSRKRIVNYKTQSFYQAISADARSKHGFNASCVIYDEVHCARNKDLYVALKTSMGAREQPLIVTITTAGVYDITTLEWELYDYAKRVRDGDIIDPAYLPVIYEIEKDEDWLDENVWHRINPALGDFRSLEEMRKLAKRAQDVPGFENEFRRLYLNEHTAQRTRWLPMDRWRDCKVDRLPIEHGQHCWGGLDLSTKTDLTAFVLVFQDGDGYAFRPWLWIPEETALRREREDRVPYTLWQREGHIEFTPGNRIDQRHIVDRITDISAEYQIGPIAVDPWNAEAVMQDLMKAGLEIQECRQRHAMMNEPCNEFEALLTQRQIKHEGNLCMDWMAGNVEVDVNRDGQIRPVKPVDRFKRVDGITALIMALGRAMYAEDSPEPAIY